MLRNVRIDWRDHGLESDMDKVKCDVNDMVWQLHTGFHALQQWQL